MELMDEHRIDMQAKGKARCACMLCHFCDMPLAPTHEHDHFPIPKNAGGKDVVPVCKNCHTLKDRVHLGNHTSVRALVEGFEDLFRFLSGSPENVTAWMEGDVTRLMEFIEHDLVTASWRTMRPYTRVLYAKIRRLHEEREHKAVSA